jgi:predicted ATPase
MPMYLRTLGGLSLEGSSFQRPKPLLLLAYLALEGPKPRRYLAELFFMDAADQMNSLSRALSYLRQDVPEVIEADNKKVWATVKCDAAELLSLTDSKQFEKCLELYEGGFAEDYDLELNEELEEWLYGTREILAAKARNAFLVLGETEASKGNFSQAALVAEKAYKLREAVELEPDDFARLYNLLYAGNSPLAAEVRKEAESFEIPLELSREEAKAQLSEIIETAHDIPNNLPPPKTSFIGRDQELIEIAQQLSKKDCRLLTLHGMGGIGKSRLAIQAAYDQLKSKQFKDGVYFVTLDALTSAELIPSSIAEALSLELQGQEDTLSQVKRFLGKKHVLLLLDNYEHLMAGATLTSKLLEACPNLKLLVTSRERLNVEEEWVLTLDGLAVPSTTQLSEAERFDALNLFVQRAKRAMLEFSLTQENLPHALKICQLVEGSPLGIELAAVWVKTLPVSEISTEIESNLNILETPTKNIPQRHQSIRAAFEHSWKLLSDKEQEVLRKLSVFVGGLRREAASEVAGATLPILASLVDKSLLRVSEIGRYDRHDLIYQFARERLQEDDEEQHSCQKQHAHYYQSLALEAEPHLKGGDKQDFWLSRLTEEINNISIVIDRAIVQNNAELALSTINSLAEYFVARGLFRQGREYYRRVLSLPAAKQHPEKFARAFNYSGFLASLEGDYADGKRLLNKSLVQYQKISYNQGIAESLNNLGTIESLQGSYSRAQALHEESLELRRMLGQELAIAESLSNLGNLAHFQGDHIRAQELHNESLNLRRELHDHSGIAISLNNLGSITTKLGDYSRAQTLFEECLNLSQKDERKILLPYVLINLGQVTFLRGNIPIAANYYQHSLKLAQENNQKPQVAASLLGIASIIALQGQNHAALALRFLATSHHLMDMMKRAYHPVERRFYEETFSSLCTTLGKQDFQTLWTKEENISLEEAITQALDFHF